MGVVPLLSGEGPRRTTFFTEVERNSAAGALKLLNLASGARGGGAAEGLGRLRVAAKFSAAERGKKIVRR